MKYNYIEHGDCIELMKSMEDNSVDLIITDPPYNISIGNDIKRSWRKSDLKKDFGTWDKGFDPIPFLKEATRISKKGIIICTSGVLFGKIHDYLYPKYDYCKYIVWNKTNPAPSIRKISWRQSTELIIHAHNKGDINFIDQKSMRNVINCATAANESLDHPSQKPIKLMEELIIRASTKRDLVLDPFMGSGTTGIACLKQNRKFIGFELNQKYINIANKRLKPHFEQRTLT